MADDITLTLPRAALVALAKVLAPYVVEASTTPKPDVYSNGPGGVLPEGWTNRRFRETAPKMGGVRSGGKRGRGVVWTVTREQYQAWISPKAPEAQQASVTQIREWIRASGYRATRSK